jgi:hypothetical protein
MIAPISPIAIWGQLRFLGSQRRPTRPKKRRRCFEANKSVGNPMPGCRPLRQGHESGAPRPRATTVFADWAALAVREVTGRIRNDAYWTVVGVNCTAREPRQRRGRRFRRGGDWPRGVRLPSPRALNARPPPPFKTPLTRCSSPPTSNPSRHHQALNAHSTAKTMAHNTEAGGSGGRVLRSLQLTYDEASVFYWQRIPVTRSSSCRIGGTSPMVATPFRHRCGLDRRHASS